MEGIPTETIMRSGSRFLGATASALLLGPAAAAGQDVASDVPYVPTPPAVVEAMLRVAGVGPDDVVFDLGSGDGRIVIAAARDFGARGTGVDIDAELVELARENARLAGVSDRVDFVRQDLFETELRDATVVTLYLLPMVNLRLRPRLLTELRPGTRIVSHAFDMDAWRPDVEMEVEGRRVMFWRVPAQVEGAWEWELPIYPGRRVQVVLDQEFQRIFGALRDQGERLVTLEEGRVDGDRLSITLVEHAEGGPVRMRFEGTVEGERIRGTVEVESGPLAGTHPSVALRSRPAPPLRRPGG
jgi:SAM-dependent methyltransferase